MQQFRSLGKARLIQDGDRDPVHAQFALRHGWGELLIQAGTEVRRWSLGEKDVGGLVVSGLDITDVAYFAGNMYALMKKDGKLHFVVFSKDFKSIDKDLGVIDDDPP